MHAPPLHQLFEQHARADPQATAVRYRGASLSYEQLNRRANRLAHRLRARGIERGALVGLACGRSDRAVAALLGILKAGAAYVPIDPSYPAEWQAMVLADSRPAALVGDPLATVDRACAAIDDGWWHDDADASDNEDPDVASEPGDLMYVIYTSGSTGAPKGVKVSHANVGRLFPAVGAHLRFDASDVWTQFHSTAFGFSVWEIWGALAHGGCLVIVPPEQTMASRRLLDTLAAEKVTVLSQTPTAFRQLSRARVESPDAPMLPHLRVVAFSGEPLENHVVEPWLRCFGDERPQLVNLYALTETSGEIAYHRVTQHDLTRDHAGVIGAPLPDVTLHLMDERGQAVGEGQVGELYVAGAAVAQGYLNRPELDAVRFPRQGPEGSQRWYRTGDLARRLGSGEYLFAGRADRQVKVRGYRVEPGQVEAALCRHPHLADAVVVAEPAAEGGTQLAAFVLPRASEPAPKDLTAFLAARLPHYAIPAHFEPVDRLPMTPNGKLDLAALQRRRTREPLDAGSAPDPSDAGPTIEDRVAAIWRGLLQLPDVAPSDDFFDLGGHSLLTLRLVMQLEDEFGVEVTMTDVFEAPTLAQLTRVVMDRRSGEEAVAGASAEAAASQHGDAETDTSHGTYMRAAIAKAREAMASGQPPYAACIVRNGHLVAAVHNVIWQNTDATAHAEVEAIREACRRLGTIDLSDCILYSTAEPCSMCLTASVWARIGTIVYAADMEDEANYGLSQPTVACRTMLQMMDRPLSLVPGLLRDEMRQVFEEWLRIKALEA